MKRVLVLLLVMTMAMFLSPVVVSAVEGEVFLSGQGIDNSRLVEMVGSGEIPADVVYLDLSNNPISDFSPLYSLTSLANLELGGIPVVANQIKELREALPKCYVYYNLAAGGVDFAGKNIDDAKLDELIESGEIPADTAHLHLANNQIKNLSPLKNLGLLTFLELCGNPVGDLSPLSSLVWLDSLHLSGSTVTDISVLSSLSHLETLHLIETGISDITPLFSLSGLKEVVFVHNSKLLEEKVNQLRDAFPNCEIFYNHSWRKTVEIELEKKGIDDKELARLVKSGEIPADVTRLHLSGNQISDISPLSGLTELEFLSLGDNQITDITPLKDSVDLEALFIGNNQISDISVLSGLTKIDRLYIHGNPITDISALSGLTKMNTLVIGEHESYKSIKDLVPLSGMTDLRSLRITGTGVTDLSPIYSAKKMSYLILVNVPVSEEQAENFRKDFPDCEFIHRNLITTNLHSKKITDKILAEMVKKEDISPAVTTLGLGYNEISDLSIINKMKKLENLLIQFNKVCDISPLVGMENLVVLYLEGNNITDITPLLNHHNLIRLHLGNSPVSPEQVAAVQEAFPNCIIEYNYVPLADGRVCRNDTVTINDALEILKYLAKLDCMIEEGNESWYAALITNGTFPTVRDALEILKYLAKLDCELSQ